eukprot:scaffold9715_cov113-Isochrysis_galbana.AAC.12
MDDLQPAGRQGVTDATEAFGVCPHRETAPVFVASPPRPPLALAAAAIAAAACSAAGGPPAYLTCSPFARRAADCTRASATARGSSRRALVPTTAMVALPTSTAPPCVGAAVARVARRLSSVWLAPADHSTTREKVRRAAAAAAAALAGGTLGAGTDGASPAGEAFAAAAGAAAGGRGSSRPVRRSRSISCWSSARAAASTASCCRSSSAGEGPPCRARLAASSRCSRSSRIRRRPPSCASCLAAYAVLARNTLSNAARALSSPRISLACVSLRNCSTAPSGSGPLYRSGCTERERLR